MQAKERDQEVAARVTAPSSTPREALPKRAVTPAGLEAASGSDRSASPNSARMAEPPRKAASSHSAADASPLKRPLEKSLPKPKATAATSALTRDMSTLGSGVLGPTMPEGSALTTTASLGASDGEESDEGSERSSTGSTQSTASKRLPPREMEITPKFKLIISRLNDRGQGRISHNIYWPQGDKVVISDKGEISHPASAYNYHRYPMPAQATPEDCEKELDRFKAGMIVQFGRFKTENATVRTHVMALCPVSFFAGTFGPVQEAVIRNFFTFYATLQGSPVQKAKARAEWLAGMEAVSS